MLEKDNNYMEKKLTWKNYSLSHLNREVKDYFIWKLIITHRG